jgi:hypothetical protein
MKQYWEVPHLWHAATAVCIGGGPSLTPAQVDHCRGRARVIAINDAYRLAPWADVLYFCDDRWWQWHAKKLADWKGMIVRLQGGGHDFGDARIKVLRNLDEKKGLAKRRDGLHTGQNSGFQAINLAVQLGAARIVLLGYDMRSVLEGGKEKTHWFGDHPGGTAGRVYEQIMLPHFESLVKPLAELGVQVINATPGSKITCFKKLPIEQALPDAEAAAA